MGVRRDKVKVFRVSRGAFLSIFRAGIPSGRMGLRDFPPLPAPGCRSALEPGCVGLKRRQQRIQLGVDGGQFQCPLLGLRLRLSRPNGQQNARWARRILPSSRAGSNPLGENQSLSSPPLKPRGLLLSVMRQKVGKERIQGGYHPLGHPPLLPELGRNNSSKTPGGRVASKKRGGPPPAGLCKEKPNLRVSSGTSPRPGWRRLARPYGSQLFSWQTNSGRPAQNNSH